MNLLYLHSHDTGRLVEPYGYGVRTPALQRLAEEGVVFRDAHAAAPTCSPSRAALLTGVYPHEAGMVGLAGRGGVLRNPGDHLAALLASRGYQTLLAGVSHVGPPDRCGYGVVRDGSPRDGEATAAFACEFLASRTPGVTAPFFLDVGFVETHRTEWVEHGFNQPHHQPHDGDGDAAYVRHPLALPDVSEVRRDWLDFRFSVERLDRYYERILASLDEAGLRDDTLVLVTTDHGPAFPRMKCRLTASGTGVLLIMRLPGRIPAESVSDALVSHIDVYATIRDLLGVGQDREAAGRSLVPGGSGIASSARDYAFSEVTFHAAFEPMRAVRSKRWNYVRSFLKADVSPLPNTDDGLSKRYLMQAGVLPTPVVAEELYDLVSDPFEQHNLAADPRCAGQRAALREALARWMVETDDPLLSSDASVLPLPMKINTNEQINPGPDSTAWDRLEWDAVSADARAFVRGAIE